jgi:hypothetical protein
MQMGVVEKSLSPCVEHREESDLVPRGSVQHVFSPPTRIGILRSNRKAVAAPPG